MQSIYKNDTRAITPDRGFWRPFSELLNLGTGITEPNSTLCYENFPVLASSLINIYHHLLHYFIGKIQSSWRKPDYQRYLVWSKSMENRRWKAGQKELWNNFWGCKLSPVEKSSCIKSKPRKFYAVILNMCRCAYYS